MTYRFTTQGEDYTDYASGRVLYNQPGAPAFPVRLVSEIFQRAYAQVQPAHRLRIYDPTSGGAYHLTALGFLHGHSIEEIVASDIDENVLDLARRNLALLSPEGLNRRENEIRRMLELYGKPSHAEALQSLSRLRLQSMTLRYPILTDVFQANAFDSQSIRHGLGGRPVDLIISDIPYGNLTRWNTEPVASREQPASPVWRMLDALAPQITARTIVAIASDKSQKISHEGYRRVERFQVGKRQVALLCKLD